MKIKDEFINSILENTNKTDQLVKRLGLVSYNSNLLKKQKQNLIGKIQQLNNEKDHIIKNISQEYGNGYVNPQTWEFHPTETEQVVAEQPVKQEN